jgi:hypothetical protein
MRNWIPGTRGFRELLRNISTEDDVTERDPKGLFSVGGAPQRRALAAVGGRNAVLIGTGPFRRAISKATVGAWFLVSGVWNPVGVWRDEVAW